MTVKELINELSKYPDNFLVLMFDAESDIGYAVVSDIIRGVNEFDGCVFIDKSEGDKNEQLWNNIRTSRPKKYGLYRKWK